MTKENRRNLNILIIHGPNLNMLGIREPDIYGKETLNSINEKIISHSFEKQYNVKLFQSNHEGNIVDFIQNEGLSASGIIINPASLSMSYPLREALVSVNVPVVEVHMSNIYAREKWHHKSNIVSCCIGQIVGFLENSYILGIEGLISYIEKNPCWKKEQV
ncbi:type II 3-dehydroquinate dehydratase [Bacillus cereus]|uniref:type II 3-dehydroquinate dehydratase n=1 Tax=Bacillus cereus TaxID=1396 RepID=UPI00065B768F|nr:type II 3-dehydroquinate dehydratase [Bacillus cereus]KMQ32163.1 hypothetical protein TU58_01365 [Bacillus cereus]